MHFCAFPASTEKTKPSVILIALQNAPVNSTVSTVKDVLNVTVPNCIYDAIKHWLFLCWQTKTIRNQYSETNVMHFLFNNLNKKLIRLDSLYWYTVMRGQQNIKKNIRNWQWQLTTETKLKSITFLTSATKDKLNVRENNHDPVLQSRANQLHFLLLPPNTLYESLPNISIFLHILAPTAHP
jgi:hypothetical protein